MNAPIAIQRYRTSSSSVASGSRGNAVRSTTTMIAVQCAWCCEVKINGRYTQLGLSSLVHEIDLPAQGGVIAHYAVSHGICPSCKERLTRRPLAA